jgi:hypothetical protein
MRKHERCSISKTLEAQEYDPHDTLIYLATYRTCDVEVRDVFASGNRNGTCGHAGRPIDGQTRRAGE